MSNYIFSTSTSSTIYVNYAPLPTSGNGHNSEGARKRDPAFSGDKQERVLIRGCANLADKVLVTHKGAVTSVTDEELGWLRKNPEFNQHVKLGFLKVETSEKSVDSAVKDMAPKDLSAPKTPNDFAAGKAPDAGSGRAGVIKY